MFLISWASGDLTNLIGCYLTDQLEFQVRLPPARRLPSLVASSIAAR